MSRSIIYDIMGGLVRKFTASPLIGFGPAAKEAAENRTPAHSKVKGNMGKYGKNPFREARKVSV